jgi:hypothetical protein
MGRNLTARRRDFAQGTKVPHDGPAEVPVRLDIVGRTGVTAVQIACMRPVLAPIMQSGSGASHLGGGGGGNVGRAARMNHGDIQQSGTMRWGKGPAMSCTLTANRCNANGSISGLYTRITARAGGGAAKSFLPLVVPARAASFHLGDCNS